MTKNDFFSEIEKYLNENFVLCTFNTEKTYIDNIKYDIPKTDFCIWRRKSNDEILICIQSRVSDSSVELKKRFESNKKYIESIIEEKLDIYTGERNKDWIRIGFRVYCNEQTFSKCLPKCKDKFLSLIRAFNSI